MYIEGCKLESINGAKFVGMLRKVNAMYCRSGRPLGKQYSSHGRDGNHCWRHRDDGSGEKDGQQYHSAPMERMERKEMGGMKVNSCER